MAEYFGKGISVGSGFDLGANLPLDNRTIQATVADRDAMPTIQLVEGLFVYVKENKTAYILKGFDPDGSNRVWETVATGKVVDIINSLESDRTDAALSAAQGKALKTLVDELKASVAAALDYKGTKDTYDALPSEGNKKGDVWNVVAAHEGTPAGTNYAWDGAKWDPLGGTVDLSGYYTKSQVDDAISAAKTELKAADTALEGQIATKIGTLDKADTAVEGQVVSAVSETDGIITVSRRALVAGDIPTLATSKISGLDTALNGKVPTTRTVNSKSLSADVVLAGTDILVGGDGTYSTNNLQEAIEAIDGRIVQAAASGVQSFGGKTGAITVRGGQAATAPAVNLTMSDNELQAAVIGVATAAQGAKADTALQSSSITSGSVNGTIAVKGSNVFVKGLGSSAYTETSAFDAAGSADSALKSAKEYADNLMVWAEFN